MSTADTTFSGSLKVRLQFPQGGALPKVRAELQGGASAMGPIDPSQNERKRAI